jgi:uncharacterized protein YkwD
MTGLASRMPALATLGILAIVPTFELPVAHADNRRFNDSVVANVYTIRHQAGCTNNLTSNAQLRLAAQWHTVDVPNNRDLDGDIGSDGSTPQDRANTEIGVWSENSLDRTVVVAVYGRSGRATQ